MAALTVGGVGKEGDRVLLSSVVEETGAQHMVEEHRGTAKG